MKYLKSSLVYLILIQIIFGTVLLRNAISVNGDCGEFAAVVKTLSIAHPPGYATYVVIDKIFSSVFPDYLFSFSLNLLSFLCHAVVSLIIFKMCHRKTSFKWLSACFSQLYFQSLLFILPVWAGLEPSDYFVVAERKYNNLAATMLGRAINVQSNKNPEIEEFKRKLFMKMISLKHGTR